MEFIMRCAVVKPSIILVPYNDAGRRGGAEAGANGSSDLVNADISGRATRRSGKLRDFDFALARATKRGALLSQKLFDVQKLQYTADGHLLLAGNRP